MAILKNALKDRRIEAALKLMDDGFAKRLTGMGVAFQVGLSRSRFEHLFREQTGTTFKLRLREIRLARGRCLLAEPRLNVKEIATLCGYAATSNFDRDFKRRFGLSPSQYRRSTLS